MDAVQIRSLRRRAGLAQTDLAAMLGVSHMSIIRWERDTAARPKGTPALLLRALQTAATNDEATLTALHGWHDRGWYVLWAKVFARAAKMPRRERNGNRKAGRR